MRRSAARSSAACCGHRGHADIRPAVFALLHAQHTRQGGQGRTFRRRGMEEQKTRNRHKEIQDTGGVTRARRAQSRVGAVGALCCWRPPALARRRDLWRHRTRAEARPRPRDEPGALRASSKWSIPSRRADEEIVTARQHAAFTDAPIYARTSGYLKRWYFDIGARVKKGDLLAVDRDAGVDQRAAPGARPAGADAGGAGAGAGQHGACQGDECPLLGSGAPGLGQPSSRAIRIG